MKDNWQRSFELMLESEGGFSSDERDKGNWMPDGRPGCTNLGVTMMTWESYVGRKSTIKEMQSLTYKDVEPLYKRKFWDACRCDDLPKGVDYIVFDLAVNGGVGRGAKTLQSVVGATPDGLIGPFTLAAVDKFTPQDVIDKFTDAKVAFYKSLNNPIYEKGWLNRAAQVKKLASEMV